MARISLIVVAVLLASTPAFAQDFGRQWIDRVTHDLQQERGPLSEKPVDFHAWGGVQYQYDSNVFLKTKKEDADSIIIPFARARLEYGEQKFFFLADLLANHKFYADEDSADGHEERFYARGRYTDARYSLDLSEIVTRTSDPIDAVFQDRVARVVSNTIGRATFDLTDAFYFEANGNFQVVRWLDDPFDTFADNNNARVDGGFGWRSPFGWEVLAQFGWYGIFYQNDQTDGAPPDADGIFVRGGFRGEVVADLSVEALIGYTQVDSDDFDVPPAAGPDGKEHSTADASIQVHYDATELVTLTAGYTRLISFAPMPNDPWQVLNRFLLRGSYLATDQIDVFARLQVDHASSSQGIQRDWWSVGGGANYVINQYVVVDASVTFRSGETEGQVVKSADYDSFILSVGVAFTY